MVLGCLDASDVVDAKECIISITKGSGGYLNSLRPGWEFMLRTGKGGQRDVRSGWNSFWKVRCASPNTLLSCGWYEWTGLQETT